MRYRLEVDEWKDYEDRVLRITTHYVIVDANTIEDATRMVNDKLEVQNRGKTRSRFVVRSYMDMGPVPIEIQDT